MKSGNPQNRPWGKGREISPNLLESQRAEIVFVRETHIPIAVVWEDPPPGSPSQKPKKWFLRSVTDDLMHEFNHRFDVYNYIELLLKKIAEEDSARG